MFYTADEKEIKQGKVTGVYFLRTKEILKQKNIKKKVVVEFVVKSFPPGASGEFLVALKRCWRF